jgi:hypothetical protein
MRRVVLRSYWAKPGINRHLELVGTATLPTTAAADRNAATVL